MFIFFRMTVHLYEGICVVKKWSKSGHLSNLFSIYWRNRVHFLKNDKIKSWTYIVNTREFASAKSGHFWTIFGLLGFWRPVPKTGEVKTLRIECTKTVHRPLQNFVQEFSSRKPFWT
jgi:hypothetical protein